MRKVGPEGRPFFRYDNPKDQGLYYDTTDRGSWWQYYWTGKELREECLGRTKPPTAE